MAQLVLRSSKVAGEKAVCKEIRQPELLPTRPKVHLTTCSQAFYNRCCSHFTSDDRPRSLRRRSTCERRSRDEFEPFSIVQNPRYCIGRTRNDGRRVGGY